jgi:leucyl aminopeptidase
MDIKFLRLDLDSEDTTDGVVVFVNEKKELQATGKKLDAKTNGSIARALGHGTFRGKRGETLTIIASNNGPKHIVVCGLGKAKKLNQKQAEEIGGGLIAGLQTSGVKNLAICFDDIDSDMDNAEIAARIAAGVVLRSYRFDKYRTKEAEHKKPSVKSVTVMCGDPKKAGEQYQPINSVLEGVYLTRDLISEPANVIHPESYVEIIKQLANDGLKIEILDEKAMTKLGMGSLLGVGQGSDKESHIAIMKWHGADDKDEQPVTLVGKGVTFDTGGISLKPGNGMEDMKWDMGGSAIVVGTMRALAKRKAKANVYGIVGLVENMPSGNAQRPGDVVTSMSGQTIEIINTDAEGRLVLADVLWYAQKEFKPKVMVDLATLTGAIIVSLGQDQYSGMFSNDDDLAKALHQAGEDTGDRTWRMPLSDEYDELINSPIADMKNMGGATGAGSITAAQFLQRFTNGVPWAHIDVAGVVWSKKSTKTWEKGATGYGVRLLDRWISDNYEK